MKFGLIAGVVAMFAFVVAVDSNLLGGDKDKVTTKVVMKKAMAGGLCKKVASGKADENHPIWWRDPWAALSIGAGVASLGVGVGFEIASERAQDDARSMRTNNYTAFQRLWESAEQRRAIAVTATLGGVVLLAAGGARLILLHRRESASDPSNGAVSFLPVRGGGALCWQGAF